MCVEFSTRYPLGRAAASGAAVAAAIRPSISLLEIVIAVTSGIIILDKEHAIDLDAARHSAGYHHAIRRPGAHRLPGLAAGHRSPDRRRRPRPVLRRRPRRVLLTHQRRAPRNDEGVR